MNTTNYINNQFDSQLDEQLYRISDVSSILNLKSHVIRNWESELDIETPRSDSGHRYYTQAEIDTFICVKKLKEHGFSLKQIKLLLPNINELSSADDETLDKLRNKLNSCRIAKSVSTPETSFSPAAPKINTEELSNIMRDIITDALLENMTAITKEIGNNVSEIVAKELNYQLIQHENIINDRLNALEGKLTNGHKKMKSKKIKESHAQSNHLPLCSRFAKRVSSDCHLS